MDLSLQVLGKLFSVCIWDVSDCGEGVRVGQVWRQRGQGRGWGIRKGILGALEHEVAWGCRGIIRLERSLV